VAEEKKTTLAKALLKSADFIYATEICTESTGATKKATILDDRNAGRRDRRPRLKVVDPALPWNLGVSLWR